MMIRIVASYPEHGQEGIEKHINELYRPIELKLYYDTDTIKEMKEREEIAVIFTGEKHPSILNSKEYQILEG